MPQLSRSQLTEWLWNAKGFAFATALVWVAIGFVLAQSRTDPFIWDDALIEMSTRDVLGLDQSLLGPYSRLGPSHPAPVMFMLLSPGYYLFGADSFALRISAALLGAGVLGVSTKTAMDYRPWAGPATVVGASLTVYVLGFDAYDAIWNPYVTIIPTYCALAMLLLIVAGHSSAYKPMVSWFFLVAASHNGTGLSVAALVAIGFAIVVKRKELSPVSVWQFVIPGMAVSTITVETVRNFPGNAWRTIEFGLTDDSPQWGLRTTLDLLLRAASPETLLTGDAQSYLGGSPALPGLVFGLLVVVATLSRSVEIKKAGGVLIVGWIAALVVLSRFALPVLGYLTVSVAPLVVLSWAVVVIEIGRAYLAMDRRTPSWAWRLRAGLSSLAVASLALPAAVESSTDLMEQTNRHLANTAIVENVTACAAENFSLPDRFQVAGLGADGLAITFGLMNQFDAMGYEPHVTEGFAFFFGTDTVGQDRVGDDERDAVLLVVPEIEAGDSAIVSANSFVVDPLTEAERAEASILQSAIRDAFRDAGQVLPDRTILSSEDVTSLASDFPEVFGANQVDLNRLASLNSRGPRTVVELRAAAGTVEANNGQEGPVRCRSG